MYKRDHCEKWQISIIHCFRTFLFGFKLFFSMPLPQQKPLHFFVNRRREKKGVSLSIVHWKYFSSTTGRKNVLNTSQMRIASNDMLCVCVCVDARIIINSNRFYLLWDGNLLCKMYMHQRSAIKIRWATEIIIYNTT